MSFGASNLSTWQTNNVVYALAQSGGRVLAGGSFTQIRPPQTAGGSAQNRAGLAIFNAETGAPDSCQYTIGGTGRVRAIAVSADGNTAWIAGEFSSVTPVGGSTVNRSRLAAINLSNCTVLSAFNGGSISAEVFGLKVFGNTLYIAGGFSTVRDQTRQYFAALNATTGALLPWVADGQSYPNAPVPKRGRAVAVSPDGTKVALGGYFYYINGTFSHSIAIVSAADPTTGEGGSLIRTYPQGFIPGNPNATSSTAEAPSGTSATHVIYSGNDGKFYIGNEGIGGGVFDGRAAFSWATGDQLWRDTCLGATQDLIEDNGTIYSANHAHDCAALAHQDGRRVYLIAQNAQTMEHYGWKPDLNDGTGEGIGPRALTIATGSSGKRYLWVGGEFTSVNGTAQQGLTRFSDASAPPATPSVTPVAMPDGSIQVRVRTVVDNDDQDLTYRVYRNNQMVWEGVATSFWWKRPQVTYVDKNTTPGVSYSYRVEVTDGTNTRQSGAVSRTALAPSAGAYGTVVRSDSPAILHWDGSMTGTSVAESPGAWVHDAGDTSPDPAGRNGLAMNGVTTTADAVPNDSTGSLVFDGTDDYIWTDVYEPGPKVYSIEAWIKTTTTRGGKIVGFGNGRPRTNTQATSLSGSYDRHIYMTNNGRIAFGAYTGTAAVAITSTQSYNDGQWHHIAATQGANGMRLYVDGVPVGSNSETRNQDYMGVWHVGGDQLNSWPNRPTSNFFAGQIDEVAIYPTILSRSRVVAHAQAGGIQVNTVPVPADAFGAAVRALEPEVYWRLSETVGNTAADSSEFAQSPGTYFAGVTKGVTGVVPGDPAAQTTGSANSIIASATATTPPSTDLSIGGWFKAAPGATGKIFGFESSQSGSNASSYDKMLYMVAGGRLIYGTYVNAIQAITTPLSYADGAWHYAMATHGADGMKLYVDGQLVGSNATTTTQSYSGYWRLGGGRLNTWPEAPTDTNFTGVIDEFTVFHKVLTAEQIAALYGVLDVDGSAPTVPTGLAATAGVGGIQLNWTASSDNVGVAKYRVYRGETPGFVLNDASLLSEVPTNAHFDNQNLETGKVYYYVVVALDAAGNQSAASAQASAAAPDLQAPSVPTGLVASVFNDEVTLTWLASTDDIGVTGYRVYRGTTADFEANDASQIATPTDPTLIETRTPGTWYYRVAATDAAGNVSPPSAAVSAAVVDGTAPTTPGDLLATVGTGGVELTWTPSTDDVAVTKYAIYRGSTADFVVGAGSLVTQVDAPATGYTDTPGLGTWYYRVTALDAAGNESPASAAAQASVIDAIAPSVPTGLAAVVSGDNVQVSWSASTDNVGVTGYEVYRGTSAGFTVATSELIGSLTGTTYEDEGRDPGTYFYKVRARDAAGNFSDLSAAASATIVAPDTTAPSVPSGVTATASGNSVTVAWSASTDNVGVTGYRVYRGVSPDFDVDDGSLIGSPSGLSFTNTALEAGTYYYVVRAADAAGNVSGNSAVVSATVSAAPVEPVTVTVNVAEDSSVVEASPTVNYGTNTQLFARGGTSAQVQQAFLKFELPAAPAGTTLTSATLRLRTSGDPAAGSTDSFAVDLVSGSWSEGSLTWNNRPTSLVANVGSFPGVATNNTTFTWNLSPVALAGLTGESATLRLTGSGGDNLRLFSKEYSTAYRPQLVLEYTGGPAPVDTQAPSVPSGVSATVAGDDVAVAWSASTDNVAVTGYEVYRGTSAGFTLAQGVLVAPAQAGTSLVDEGRDPGTYFYKVRARDAAGNFSDLSAAASATITGPDTSAPSVPSGVTATVSGNSVTVAWSASTDNVGVTGYRVYRGVSPDFDVDQSSLIGSPSGLSYSDNNRPVGTYYYVVRAADAAGNLSGNSAVVSASVTPPPVEPVTVTVPVAEDSSVVEASPTVNYGTNTQLFARGGTSAQVQQAFLKFEVPAAPAGTTLTSATLRLRTSGDPAAGSTDSFAVDLVSGSWSEGSLTWNNRPTSLVANVGSIPGVATNNTNFTVDLNVEQLADVLGETASLRLTGSGGDNLRMFSKEYSISYRPQLTLVFSADPEAAGATSTEMVATAELPDPEGEAPAADTGGDESTNDKSGSTDKPEVEEKKGDAAKPEDEAAAPKESSEAGTEGGAGQPAGDPEPPAKPEPAPEAPTGP